MTDRNAIDTEYIASILTRSLEQPVRKIHVEGFEERLYSCIWHLKADTEDGGSVALIAKSYRSPKGLQTQLELLSRTASAYQHRADVCIPYLGSSRSRSLLLMPQIDDPSLQQLFRLSRGQSLRDWRMTVVSASTRLGRWLSEWHEMTASTGPLDAALERYLSAREDHMALVSSEHRRQLCNLVRSLGTEKISDSHGDFTPLNVLWSPERITILDFGISEWDRMSPWWDYITMEVGIARGLHFMMKSPGMWIPGISRLAVAAFKDGYGEVQGTLRARYACLAIRHLTLHWQDQTDGEFHRLRARWHKKQFQKTLALAQQSS